MNLAQHPGLIVAITFISNYVVSAFISSLPAPQGNSSSFYVFVFKFTNALAANLARAKSTAVEGSPNFQKALDKQTDLAGVPQINVIPISPKETS